MLYQEIN